MSTPEFSVRRVSFNCPKYNEAVDATVDLTRLQQQKTIYLGCTPANLKSDMQLITVNSKIDEQGIVDVSFVCGTCGEVYRCLFEE